MIVRILIPAANYATISAPHHRVFERFLVAAFGSVTRPPVLLSGESDAVRYDDTVLVFAVSVVTEKDKISLVEAIEFARTHYSQPRIFAEFPR
jgi:hypothetical protein